MPRKPFEPGNQFAKQGGLAKRGHGFKQEAVQWVRDHGFTRAIAWVDGRDGDQDVPWPQRQFAMGLLFSYALGRPAEKLQIDDRKEIYVNLSKDPDLNALAQRFGIQPGRVLEARDSSVVDGAAEIQAESPPAHGV